jgi:glycosyltransferase involved in cell wall biosynthesis
MGVDSLGDDMNPAVIIPTFHVTTARGGRGNADSIYDHPTPLNSPGTLARCLESLQQVKGLGQVIITVSHNEAVEKVKSIVDQFPQMHTLVISESEAQLVQHRLEQLGFGDTSEKIGVTGYSAVRNFGIIVATVLGFDSVVFVDDDEIIDDPEFLSKAMYGLGKLTKREIPILAKSGYYLNAKGTYLSLSQNKWYNHFWEQGSAFNEWISKAMSGPRLSRSNHVCGGCLALHKQAYMRVCFDPWVVRGEDLDYLLNLRMYGSDVWFDNQWYLHHLPPQERHEGRRFRRDIYRWVYEYYKIEFSQSQIDLLQIKPSSLEPYPGPFLERGLEKRIKKTALLRSLARPDKAAYRKAATAATNQALIYAQDNCNKYFDFQRVWVQIMAQIENDTVLQQALIQAALVRETGGEIEVYTPQQNVDPGLTSEIHLNLAEEE